MMQRAIRLAFARCFDINDDRRGRSLRWSAARSVASTTGRAPWKRLLTGVASIFLLIVVCVPTLDASPRVGGGPRNQKRQVVPASEGPSTANPKTGVYYALVIGIQDYRHLGKLNTPVNDAKAVATILHDQYRFKATVLLDATRRKILDALDRYRARLQDGDSLLVYYAGHGLYDSAADLAYWAPVDAETSSHDDWIVSNEITGVARAIPARHILIVSDSCYSGMLTRDARIATFAPSEHNAYIARMLQGKSRRVMSSGGNEPVADGDASGSPADHSVFANALLEGLRQINMDAFSAEELFSQYVEERVAGRSSQMPEYNFIRDSGHEDGDFVFFRASKKHTAAARDIPPQQPQKTAAVASSKDSNFILRNFKTMFVEAKNTHFFSSATLKAALTKNKDFASLNVQIVDDPAAADVALEVTYAFAWDYPFELKHQASSKVLLAGQGSGPFSGPVGATSVAAEFVKLAKPYRTESAHKD
jgi:uncharacterized caspase-like protein